MVIVQHRHLVPSDIEVFVSTKNTVQLSSWLLQYKPILRFSLRSANKMQAQHTPAITTFFSVIRSRDVLAHSTSLFQGRELWLCYRDVNRGYSYYFEFLPATVTFGSTYVPTGAAYSLMVAVRTVTIRPTHDSTCVAYWEIRNFRHLSSVDLVGSRGFLPVRHSLFLNLLNK